MYLKSIEVQGFKSFANKIVFDFHNGITGIVGPNGSGKSNVADAVRWVLGEQSAKQLRGSKMEDVIFAGTENRKPVGFAFVSITLDNSDHALPVDYDEVTVSRRVYRSGESEYLINGNSCRLKDVTEMFYDTGIGKEGYSIIGQGQIDKILSGKPDERRELFDEAAGIVKFKRRKATAIKKLENERANLVRVNDILSELEKQVGPLQVQSEKAKEYLSLFRKAEHVTLLALPDLSGVIVDFVAGESTAVSAEFYFSRYEGDWNALLRALFSDDIKKVSHNVKDLQRTLLENDLPIEGFIFDTALAGYLLDATAGKYDIASLFAAYFHQTLAEPKHLDPDAFSMLGDTAEAETAFHVYTSAVDALYEAFAPELEKRELHELYYEVELPLCAVLARMEHAGMRVDANALAAFGSEMEVQLKTLEQHIYEEAGGPFNINSPKQLGEVLFERLQLPHGKKTKTGWSTNADVLEKLRWENPIVEEVLQYRQYAKFRSTYCDGLLKVIAPDGRIHTSFQMTVTATGRLSSTEPNLQNIPTRTQLGSEFRRMFVPADGCVLVDADYSQIELRLLAHIADDEAMKQAFLTGEDIHTVTAAQVFGVPTDQVTKQMRSHAKAVNFGIVYGISAFSLAQDIGVPVYEAKEYIETYFERFPGIRRYMDEVVAQAKERGYVETLMHRRRALPELAASNFNTRSFGERVARNMPIQGTAADVIKLAMVRVDERLHKEDLKAKLILQVHDELIVECPEEEKETVARLLTEEMEGAVHLSVPLTAEAHWGINWLEAK